MKPPSIVVQTIGRELQPIVIVENFVTDPEALRRHAATAASAPDDLHYPGLKRAVPADYFDGVQPILSTILHKVFGFSTGVSILGATYSIVSTEPHVLSVEQRMPHVDAIDPGRMAMMHYLGPGDVAGTAFYRHRSTGFETITEARSPVYFASLNADIRTHGEPSPAYICADTSLFEQTALVEGHFNRALIYRSALLHSGAIPADHSLSPDPLTGRLTIASFLAAA